MTRFGKISTLVAAGSTAMLLGTASFASGTSEYKQLETSVIDGLHSLNVPSSQVAHLTMAEVAQLSQIIDSTDPAADRAAAATQIIDSASHPEMASMSNPGAAQMADQLKAQFETAGLAWPGAEKLTLAQVDQLSVAFATSPEAGHKLATTVLDQINHPVPVTMGNAGAQQLQAELQGQLQQVGLKLPANDKLTFKQVSDLSNIFASNVSQDDMKAAAMKVLAIN
jgi:hypothetical protein